MPITQPQLRARVVLFDIDDTLVTNGRPDARHEQANPFLSELSDLVQRTHQIDADEAAARVRKHTKPNGEIVEPCLELLGLKREQFVHAMIQRLRPNVQPCADAVETVRALHERGYQLYPATTNGRIACLAKLTIAGLAEATGSPYFCDLFGGAEIAPEGKTSPAFYQALLQRIAARPNEVVMVGDHPVNDLALAREAGINQVVLPRRDQTEDCVVSEDGGIYVRSLTWLLHALPERPT